MGAMDELISPHVITQLFASLRKAAPTLHLQELGVVEHALPGARLRDRVNLVRDGLLSDLPQDFASTHNIIQDALDDPSFTGWMIWPVTELIATRGLASGATEDFDAAMSMLTRLTLRLSSEFAIRDLITARPERALMHMQTWTQHENEHVRRLATEGSRAYLPWAKRVPWLLAHPRATLSILAASYRDPAEYVRRSVANHLNDLSRVDPAVVLATATGWAESADENTPWVLRHGLRTLNKQGNRKALTLLGFSGENLYITQPALSGSHVPWNGELGFTAEVTNDGDLAANVAIDYAIGFQRANGSISSKTFKLTSRQIGPGETVTLRRTHSFRPITTRRYYAGPHFVAVQANGELSAQADFTLGLDPTTAG